MGGHLADPVMRNVMKANIELALVCMKGGKMRIQSQVTTMVGKGDGDEAIRKARCQPKRYQPRSHTSDYFIETSASNSNEER